MYGNNDYFFRTLIFIISLMKKNQNMIQFCYTYDVPKYKIDILKKYYTVVEKLHI